MFYELSLFSQFAGQRCVNVFNYVLTGTPAAVSGSFGLAYAFGSVLNAGIFPTTGLFAKIKALVSTGVQFTQVRVKNPYDVTDFYSVPFAAGTTGAITGESMSPTQAFSVRSNQTRLDIQAGQKRFPGVSESSVGTEGIVAAGAVTLLTAITTAMSAPASYDDEGNTLLYNIVVAKKTMPPNVEGTDGLGYFPTLSEQLDNVATGLLWTQRAYISTQTTRQYGRGR